MLTTAQMAARGLRRQPSQHEDCPYCGKEMGDAGCNCNGFRAEQNSNRGQTLPAEEKDFLPFLNGADIADCADGVEVEVIKVRTRKNGDGFFVDVKADDGNSYTMNANTVLTHMMLQKLEGSSFKVYPYEKGEGRDKKFFLSLRQQESSSQSSGKTGASKKPGYSKR